jgi:hypothetical protein
MNMAVKVIDRLLIVVYGILDPTDADWQSFLKLVESHGIVRTQHLIYTDGGAPTVQQHRELDAVLAGRIVPTAVVSDSLLVRGRLAAISWFDSSIKPFPPSGLADALRFLEVPVNRYDLVTRELQRLRTEIDQEHDV